MISERNAAALAKSEFCVPLLYCMQTPNNVFMVMEYMIGGDLKSLLGMYGCFPEHQAVFYLASMVLALQYLHKRGIVHRDIKPDNMLLSASGHLKLTDFGLSTTGLRDRELQVDNLCKVYNLSFNTFYQVADLVGRTPWHAGPHARFVRTPGQILSLTSHLSFSSQRSAGDPSSGVISPGGSFLQSSSGTTNPLNCSTNSAATRTTPMLPRSPSHPNSLPLTRLSNSRPPLRRKNSFAESLAKCQTKAALEAKTPHSPKQGLLLGSSPNKDPDSSFQLQPMPNSSMDLGSKNQTMEWKSESSPMKASQSERECGKENVVPMLEGRHSPDLHLDLPFPDTQILANAHVTPPKVDLAMDKTPPLRLFLENDDSLGSLSSSPKPLASSLLPLSSPPISPVHGSPQSPLVKQATFLPTSPLQCSSPDSSSPRSEGWLNKRIPSPKSSPSSTPILSPKSCLGPHSNANMRALRQRSGNTPETLRTLFDEDSDLHLEATLDKMEENMDNMVDFKKDFLDQSALEEDDEGDVVFTVPGGTPVQEHGRPEKRFKMPTPFPLLSKKRKISSFSSNCSSNSTGLTDDLTELAVLKRPKPSDIQSIPQTVCEAWKMTEQKEMCTSLASRSSSEGLRQSKSSCSSEEEQGTGYGCSTPVFSPLSAIPRRMKAGVKGKAVQFKSPAGVFTPVQPPCKPGLTLAHLDAESAQMTTPPPLHHQQRTSSPAVAGLTTPFRLVRAILNLNHSSRYGFEILYLPKPRPPKP